MGEGGAYGHWNPSVREEQVGGLLRLAIKNEVGVKLSIMIYVCMYDY